MKRKISINIDEDILKDIDQEIDIQNSKDRDIIIENILKSRYSRSSQVSCIIFCHDYKWDNREYPFDIPKSLLKIKQKSIIYRLIRDISSSGIKNFVISIPKRSKKLFEEDLKEYIDFINIDFIEVDSKIMTGEALKILLKNKNTRGDLIIANGDIYYGNLKVKDYYKYHNQQKSDFSFLLKLVLNPEQLGNIIINGNKVIDFVEKQKANKVNLTNAGLYITSRKFLDNYNFGKNLEIDFFPRLSLLGNIIGYNYPYLWEHIQNDSAYERINGWLI